MQYTKGIGDTISLTPCPSCAQPLSDRGVCWNENCPTKTELNPTAQANAKKGLQVKSTNPKDVIGIKKVPLHLIPATAKIHQALAHKNGAIKYGPFNWREEGVSASVYISACERHLDAWFDGEENAQDSGIHHLGHAIACLNIILDAMEVGNLVDDRPTPAPTGELLEKYQEGV